MTTQPLEFAYAQIKEHLASITNPVIFELGVCDGYHTQMLLSWCKSTPRYFGFEPDPRNVSRLLWDKLSIEFYPNAIGDTTGKVPFYLSTPEPNGCVGSSSISEFNHELMQKSDWMRLQSTVEVQCWRLDDFCRSHAVDHIDFLWMDVQGAERLVFDGAPNMLSKTKLLWTEYGGRLYKDCSELDDILAYFPGWQVICESEGNVLLANKDFI